MPRILSRGRTSSWGGKAKHAITISHAVITVGGWEGEPGGGREISTAQRPAAGSRLLGVARVPIHQQNYGTRKTVTTGQVPKAVRTHGPSHRHDGEEEEPDQKVRESAEVDQRSVRERRHAPEPRQILPTCSHDVRRTPKSDRCATTEKERRLGDSTCCTPTTTIVTGLQHWGCRRGSNHGRLKCQRPSI